VLAEDLEDILSTSRAATSRIQQLAPGVLQGAATGFVAGGPAGALAGGALGAAGGLANPRGAAAPSRAAAATISSPLWNPAALELLLTALRPEVIEALIAMALGRLGARTIPVGNASVPVQAFGELIGALASEALSHHEQYPTRAGSPRRYLAEALARGEDIDEPSVRAESLRTLLRETADDF